MPVQTQFPAPFFVTVIPPVITTTSLPNGTIGEEYFPELEASGASPMRWEIVSGAPDGIVIDPQTGVFSGSPTEGGQFTVTIRVRNAGGSDQQAFSLNILPATPTITSPSNGIAASSTPLIQVAAVMGATGYDFEIYKLSDNSLVASVTDHDSTDWTVSPSLTNYDDYYVTVKARSGEVTSEASAPVSFTVSPAAAKMNFYWKLDESGTGQRNDSHGTAHLTSINDVPAVTGKINNCAQFISDNAQRLTRANEPALQTGDVPFMFGAWVWIDSMTPSTNQQTIAIKGSNPLVNSNEWALYYADVSGNTRLRWRVGATVINSSGGNVSRNAWHFVVCWHDPDADKIFLQIDNGTPLEATLSGGVTPNTNNLSIGGTGLAGQFADVRVDEAFYGIGQLLDSTERTYIYNEGAGRQSPFSSSALSAYFDEMPNGLDFGITTPTSVTGAGSDPDDALYLQVTSDEPGYAKGTLHYIEIAASIAKTAGKKLVVDFVTLSPLWTDAAGFLLNDVHDISMGAFSLPHTVEIRGETRLDDCSNIIFKDIRFRAGWSPQSYAAGKHVAGNWQALQVHTSNDICCFHVECLEGEDDTVGIADDSDKFYFVESMSVRPGRGSGDVVTTAGEGKAFTGIGSIATGWDRIAILNSIIGGGNRAPRLVGSEDEIRHAQVIGNILLHDDGIGFQLKDTQHTDIVRNTSLCRVDMVFKPSEGDIHAWTDISLESGETAEIYVEGNRAIRANGSLVEPAVFGTLVGQTGRYPLATVGTPHTNILTSVPSRTTEEHYTYTLENAGCRPEERDDLSQQLIAEAQSREWLQVNHIDLLDWFHGFDENKHHIRE